MKYASRSRWHDTKFRGLFYNHVSASKYLKKGFQVTNWFGSTSISMDKGEILRIQIIMRILKNTYKRSLKRIVKNSPLYVKLELQQLQIRNNLGKHNYFGKRWAQHSNLRRKWYSIDFPELIDATMCSKSGPEQILWILRILYKFCSLPIYYYICCSNRNSQQFIYLHLAKVLDNSFTLRKYL